MRLGDLDSGSVYTTLSRQGACFDPAHRAIKSIQLGERQLLAHLFVPPVFESTQEDYGIHPSLMTGALQACVALIDGASGPVHDGTLIGLKSLRIEAAGYRSLQ
jgi:hypothetical protein